MGSRLSLTLPLILSVNKAIQSTPTAKHLAWACLADTCHHPLNSADLLSLFVGGGKNCCHTVEVIQGGNRYGALQDYPEIFTKFYMDSVAQRNGRVRYLSQDETWAIAIGNNGRNWEIQTERDK